MLFKAIIVVVFLTVISSFYVCYGQLGNVGIGTTQPRARLEVHGVAGTGSTNALFGGESTGVSFQSNWPTIGFNQYRSQPGGYGMRIGNGYAAIQYLDPASGYLGIDMHGTTGIANTEITGAFRRALTIFSNGSVSFGGGYYGAGLGLSGSLPGGAEGLQLRGTQYHSNLHMNFPGTNISPGKAGGTTFINDIPGGHMVIGANTTQVYINTTEYNLNLTLNLTHPNNGLGLAIIHATNFNNWEWYLSNDSPAWLALRYNGLLVGAYNPVHGAYTFISDKRLKMDRQPLQPVLQRVMQLNPVSYELTNAHGMGRRAGFIAQEIAELFPEMVSRLGANKVYSGELPDLQMLSYSQFFVLATKAIQEQQERIGRLQAELLELERPFVKQWYKHEEE